MYGNRDVLFTIIFWLPIPQRKNSIFSSKTKRYSMNALAPSIIIIVHSQAWVYIFIWYSNDRAYTNPVAAVKRERPLFLNTFCSSRRHQNGAQSDISKYFIYIYIIYYYVPQYHTTASSTIGHGVNICMYIIII